MINTLLTVNGTPFTDFVRMTVTKNADKSNASSNFKATFDSPFGKMKGKFIVGEEVIVYADKDTDPASTKIFTGLCEKVKFTGEESTQKCIISGRDYMARLQDVTVEPSVYTDSEISTIVTNIIDLYVSDVTTTNVNVTAVSLEKIGFNHQSCFEAIKKLAKLAGFIFYIDENKDLHFEEVDTDSSVADLNRDNIVQARFDTTRDGMANKVWVYGDRILTGTNELFKGTGSTDVYTLASRPHNTQVFVDDVLITPGGVASIGDLSMADSKYLVDFDNRTVTFTSGASLGNNIPIANSDISIDYDRRVPIVKFGQNQTSIDVYGPKEKVINDKALRSNDVAQQLLTKVLEDSNPFKNLELKLSGWFTFALGEQVSVTLEDFNLAETVDVININYTFDKNTVQSEEVMTCRVDKKFLDITDAINDLTGRLENLENPEFADLLTRFYQTTGQVQVIGSAWKISTRQIGSGLILGHSVNGRLGAPYFSAAGPQIVLGAPLAGWIIESQGGYY